MASLPCHQVNLGTAQICDRDFSFEAMFSTKRAQRKTLSGSEVIGLQFVYPDDRIGLQLNIIPAGMVVVVCVRVCVCVWWGGGGVGSCLETGKY